MPLRTFPQRKKPELSPPYLKKYGIHHSTDNIRPISVGPIIGRLVNKLLANRLGAKIGPHSLLDPAQFAFLKGKNTHEPINSITACFRKAQAAPTGSSAKACYAIFYDITKAYDALPWPRIKRALHRLRLPQDFIDMTMNMHYGTHLTMRTSIPGRTTKPVQMHKAIKQGCPLAPLLFSLVLDELHAGYRTIENAGFPLDNHTRVYSRGYCDDTCIIAQDLTTLQRMNDYTAQFMKTHNLTLSHTKSNLVGQDMMGTALTTTITWSTTNKPLHLVQPDTPIRYLGAHLTLNDTWTTQEHKLNGTIMHLVSCIKHRRLTLLQIGLLLREVTLAKLDTGFRHAIIPDTRLPHPRLYHPTTC